MSPKLRRFAFVDGPVRLSLYEAFATSIAVVVESAAMSTRGGKGRRGGFREGSNQETVHHKVLCVIWLDNWTSLSNAQLQIKITTSNQKHNGRTIAVKPYFRMPYFET